MDPHNMNANLLPFQIGYTVTSFLFGFTTVQTFLYYQDFNDDPRILRTMVAFLWLSDAAHQIFCSYLVYFVTITCYGNIIRVVIDPQMLVIVSGIIFLTGFCITLVLGFYNYRLWYARKQKLVAAFLSLLSLARLILCLMATIHSARSLSLLEFISKHKPILLTVWAVGAAEDILLTFSLCFDWYEQRHSDLYQSAKFVDRLVIWCFGTGATSSMIAIALLASFILTSDKNLIWVAFFLPVPKFFSNSLLVSLNARSTLRTIKSNQAINMVSHFHAAQTDSMKADNIISVQVAVTSDSPEVKKDIDMDIKAIGLSPGV